MVKQEISAMEGRERVCLARPMEPSRCYIYRGPLALSGMLNDREDWLLGTGSEWVGSALPWTVTVVEACLLETEAKWAFSALVGILAIVKKERPSEPGKRRGCLSMRGGR